MTVTAFGAFVNSSTNVTFTVAVAELPELIAFELATFGKGETVDCIAVGLPVGNTGGVCQLFRLRGIAIE